MLELKNKDSESGESEKRAEVAPHSTNHHHFSQAAGRLVNNSSNFDRNLHKIVSKRGVIIHY